MISLQTNVDSLLAQDNLSTDNQLQSQTIQQLTSGYRINSSGDDAAGLAIANSYRDNIAELTQGVNNANDGVAQLQIIDGGLSNISTILDRLKTLATESASGTFTGSRATLNQEYQQDLTEITRQASNINLNQGGSFNSVLNVYIGGANNAQDANVQIDLSGNQNAVDATSLGLSNTNVLAGGLGFTGNTTSLTNGVTLAANQTFTFNVYSDGTSQQVTATVNAGSYTSDQILSTLNNSLSAYGISAQLGNDGTLQFTGATAFAVTDAGGGLTTAGGGTAENTSNYIVDGAAAYTPTAAEALQFQTASGSTTVNLTASDTVASAIAKINAQTASLGVYAVANAAGTGISLQSSSSFSVYDATAGGVFGAAGNTFATAPTSGDTTNAESAITAINQAIKNLGLVQGVVGAGENKLQYAINLANSQIANESTAESDIRDANVATDAANLTKSQVLEQTAIAALAQANAEPQSVLKLFQ
jgi:flagellin